MKDQLPMNGNADIENAEWIVTMQEDDTGSKRVTVKAMSEMGAIIEAEERFGGTAISARLKPASRVWKLSPYDDNRANRITKALG